jgi:glycosyltransferase involved in cell wall biosynthesis
MFGLGPMQAQLQSMISEMKLQDCISFHGPIEAQEFSDYLQSVSFLVIPSRIESIPVVFSDALQIGTPVISMPVGDLGRLIKQYRCGLVATEASPEALAASLEESLSISKDSFKDGISTACEQFRTDKIVHKWLSF